MPRGVYALAAVAVGMLVLTAGSARAHEVPFPCDFTTGGGFVFKDNDARVNFGIVGGCKNEGFYGHVNVVDHDTGGVHVNGPVTGYFDPFPPSEYRDLCGTDKKTGEKFRVRTKDNGEPGGLDRFGAKLGGVVIVSTRELGPGGGTATGGGGNIQRHKDNPSTTGPDSPPDELDVCPDASDLGD